MTFLSERRISAFSRLSRAASWTLRATAAAAASMRACVVVSASLRYEVSTAIVSKRGHSERGRLAARVAHGVE